MLLTVSCLALLAAPPRVIRLLVAHPYREQLHLASLQSAGGRLGYRVEVEDDVGQAGEGALRVRMVEGRLAAGPKLLGWSQEDPVIDISLPRVREIAWRGLQKYWDCRAPLPAEVYDEAVSRVLTYTLKHEVFVHQIGQFMSTRGRPYRMDYDTAEYLDSAHLSDVFWDGPHSLRPDHPYLLDQARLGR